MRYPAVAGSFYPSNAKELKSMIEKFVTPNPDSSIIACISPHAGYIYSGRTAGKVLSLLPKAETYVIIGPNHHGYGSAIAVSTQNWITPLGEVKTDIDFINALPKKIIDTDESAHRFEHSLEVQLPFLQHLFDEFKIVTICMAMQDEDTAKEVAEEILEAKRKTNRNIVVIASSDMHHYLPDNECRKLDAKVIDAILSGNVSRFYKTIYELNASVCGYGPIAVAMHYSNHFNAKAELVHYSTSGDVASKSSVVGYAGIVFKI